MQRPTSPFREHRQSADDDVMLTTGPTFVSKGMSSFGERTGEGAISTSNNVHQQQTMILKDFIFVAMGVETAS